MKKEFSGTAAEMDSEKTWEKQKEPPGELRAAFTVSKSQAKQQANLILKSCFRLQKIENDYNNLKSQKAVKALKNKEKPAIR